MAQPRPLPPTTVYHQSVPLHHQVGRLLRTKIESGEWAPGERMPTEMALVGRFRVSRTTLREALGALARDGLIVRHRRRGTFVREPGAAAGPQSTITNLVFGFQTQVRVLAVDVVPAPGPVAAFLGVARGVPIRRFTRLQSVEGRPLAVVRNYMTRALGARITRQALSRASMLEVLRDRLRIPLGRIHQQIEARLPDDDVAALLAIDLTQPVLLVRLHVSDRSGRPVDVTETCYRADRYRYEDEVGARVRRRGGRRTYWQGQAR